MIYLINAESTATENNNGMKTVDIAWELFLKRNNINIPYKRYSIKPQKNIIKITNNFTLKYESLIGFKFDSLSSDDILIYWGDFLHSNHYIKNDLKRIANRRKTSLKRKIFNFLKQQKNEKVEKEAKIYDNYLDLAYKYHLLENIEPHWKKTISFGTTFVGDSEITNFYDDRYNNAFNEFIQNKVDNIFVREVFSAFQIAHIKNDYYNSYLGIDAALLNNWSDYKKIIDQKPYFKQMDNTKYILIHFTRTHANINELLNFVFKINEKLKLDIYWIPWLVDINHKQFSKIKHKYKKNIKKLKTNDYSDLIYAIKNASLIITDTYHLSLVGWKLHTPVIAIGSGTQLPISTVDDKKKEIFYGMYNALPLYFYSENLNNNKLILKFIENIQSIINNKNHKVFENIYKKIDNHSKSIEKFLIKSIKNEEL